MKALEINSQTKGKIVATLYVLVSFLFFFALKCEAPKKEEFTSEGVMVNLGFMDDGQTDNTPEATEQEQMQDVTPENAAQDANETEEQSAIQETEIVNVNASDKPVSTNKPTKPTQTTMPTQPTKPTQQVNQDALFQNNNNNPNQGDGNTNGDKGNPNGSLESNIYGDITGPGLGDSGKGWGLNGRQLGNKPTPTNEQQVFGKVTVKIKVGKNGKVINAEFSSKGSTTTNSYLVSLSVKEAYKVTFNPDAKAPDVQVGFVTFDYKPL